MAPKNTEDLVYPAVETGEIAIDQQGQIWRVATRRGKGRTGKTHTLNCIRRRAEHDTGIYLMMRVMINGKRAHALAHRLIWRHFNGPISAGLTINHKNGDKKDNRPENLELATYSEQVIHAHRVLGKGEQSGMKNHRAKLTTDQVAEIRHLRQTGMLLREIAARYKVAEQTISKIVRGDRRSLG